MPRMFRLAGYVQFLPAYMLHVIYECDWIQVEVFPNTGVLCERFWWAKAKHATSAGVCCRSLVQGVFDTKTLLVSNLKGGTNKRGLRGIR